MLKVDGHSTAGFPAPSGHAYQIKPPCSACLDLGVFVLMVDHHGEDHHGHGVEGYGRGQHGHEHEHGVEEAAIEGAVEGQEEVGVEVIVAELA